MKDLKKYEYIVFAHEHYNPLGIVRSLGEENIFCIGIIIKGKKRITSSSKYFSQLYMVDSIEDGYALLKDKFCDGKIKFLLTADDTCTSFFDSRYDELKNNFIFYNAGENGRITKYMDKELLCELACKFGLKIPRTWKVTVGEIPKDIIYPVITKAPDSIQEGWKNNVFVCYSEKDLLDAYSKMCTDEIIIQQYIKKSNELCLDGISINRGKNVFITMASTYNYLLPDSYSFTFTLENFSDEFIQNALVHMMSEIGFEGIFTMEFIIDENDQMYFMEINFRHSAWGYASTKLGMNLITNWAYGMLNGNFRDDIYKKIPKDFVAMVELPDFKNRVLKHHMNVFKWIKEVKKCSCFYYANREDSKPFWSAVLGSIIK